MENVRRFISQYDLLAAYLVDWFQAALHVFLSLLHYSCLEMLLGFWQDLSP